MKAEPKEITVTASFGATVEIVKFEYTAKFNYIMGQTWDVDGSEEELEIFKQAKVKELRESLEIPVQREMDDLMTTRDNLYKRNAEVNAEVKREAANN